jgi:hypothetical protein
MTEKECIFCEKMEDAPDNRQVHKIERVEDTINEPSGEYVCGPCLEFMQHWKNGTNVVLLTNADFCDDTQKTIRDEFTRAMENIGLDLHDDLEVNAESGGID